MIRFSEWLRKRRRVIEGFDDSSDPVDKFKFNSGRGSDVAGDYEKDLQDLAKVVMCKYNQEFRRFLNQLSDERGDSELRTLLRKLDTERGSPDPWGSSHPQEPDEVVAPKADRGSESTGGSN